MWAAESGDRERERAAFALATAYASPSPARTAASSGGWATCRRPMTARSTASIRHIATGGRASSARSRRGWAGEIDEQVSVGLDFRRRRAALMRRPRGPACETMGSGAVNDLEALEDQNQRLKVALSRLFEENKRYRVNKTRLEGELLRADAKVELLLSELEQAPGKRDQRLLNAARIEVEKCAVVRSLAKQNEHLQKMLARQERELDAMKQTKEWSAVVEMTAATEEYFLEIRRLQRLLAQQQQQQGALTNGPVAGVSDREGGAAREAYVPNQRGPTQRRDSGVDDTVWIHRPETCEGDVSMSILSPADGVQENQRILDAEMAFTRGGGDVYNVVHGPTSASAEQADQFHVAHREDNDMPLHEWGASALRRRPASPKRRVSSPRRARMATRAGRETFGFGTHKKLSEEPHGSRQTTQTGRRVFGRKQRGGSQSQVWIRAEEARTGARGADARRSAVGVRSRPLSAPRTKRELKMTTGDARRSDSLSAFDNRRRQVASSDRGAPSGSGGGDNDARVRQKTTPADHRIPTVPAPTEPRSWETGEKRRPKPRSRSASPRSSSSRNRTGAGDDFRVRGEVPTPTASATGTKHRTMGRKDESAGGDDCGDGGGSDAGSPGVAVAPRSSQRAAGESESPPHRDDEGTSDDVYNDDAERRLSSSVPSRSLAAAVSVEYPSPTSSAKECEEGTIATTQGQEGNKEQTADGGILDPAGSGDAENAGKAKESRVAEGGELARNLVESGPSWGSFEAVGEPPNNEAKEQNTEEGSARPVSSPTSSDIDARENPNADATTEKNSTTRSTRNIKSGDGGEQQVTAAEKTGELTSSAISGGNGSPNDGDNNSSSPLPEVGDDNTITRSVSSHAVTEKDHQGGVEVDAELETDKLLFDIEGDGDSVGDEPLIGENGAAPSEYGDDFDDFEDDED